MDIGLKIVFTGVGSLFASLLLLLIGGYAAPKWLERVCAVIATLGLLMAFIGSLTIIWR